jgi:hypothetical protein
MGDFDIICYFIYSNSTVGTGNPTSDVSWNSVDGMDPAAPGFMEHHGTLPNKDIGHVL